LSAVGVADGEPQLCGSDQKEDEQWGDQGELDGRRPVRRLQEGAEKCAHRRRRSMRARPKVAQSQGRWRDGTEQVN